MQHKYVSGQVAPFLGSATLCALLLSGALRVAEADFLDSVDQTLSFSALNNQVRFRISGTLDLETYYVEQPPPGLIFTDNDFLFNPRLTLFLDTQIGSHISSFVQVRVDRGFDPSDGGAQIRLDE